MANGLGGLIDNQSFDDVYHTTKFLEDVSMLMSVEIGRCEMTVRDVLALKVGSLVEFSKVVGEPMDVIIADRLMARGEVVVVNERYGVRISEVTRPDEKIGDRREYSPRSSNPQILATPLGKSGLRCHTPGIPQKNP